MNLRQSIRSCVESFYPILYLTTFEEEDSDRMIGRLADGRKILEWNLAHGMVRFDTKAPLASYMDLPSALKNWLDQDLNGQFLIVKDAHLALRDNPVATARLKTLAQRIAHDDATIATVFLISPEPYVPPELEKFITIFEWEPPDEDEIKQIVRDRAKDLDANVEDDVAGKLALAFRGLSRYEIGRLLDRAYQQDGAIGEEDIALVLTEKEQIVKKTGILEMVQREEEGTDALGGLQELKTWLKRKAEIMNDLPKARKFGVDEPKGAMVVGFPGCGKSLTAKATATLFDLPLLRLDVGSLMGRYVGDSEANMRRALKLAEAVSPCVLWVDEIEKAFAGVGGSGSDSQIATRLFGYFLTWMQEKTRPVFVLATANDISVLPPEFLRKGRLDEIFHIDLPDEGERAEIVRVHLRKRRKKENGIDIAEVARSTKGFSGADLENVVKDAIEQAFVDGQRSLTTSLLLDSAKEAVPLAQLMKDKLKDYPDKLRSMGVKSASSAKRSRGN